jgi:hypothetical protein
MAKKTIVLYHPDFTVDPEVLDKVRAKGDVRFCNADYFNARDLEPASLVVLAPGADGKELKQAKAITEAYKGVKVVSLDEFLKGKVEVPAEPKKEFNPDAPLEAKAAKAKK